MLNLLIDFLLVYLGRKVLQDNENKSHQADKETGRCFNI